MNVRFLVGCVSLGWCGMGITMDQSPLPGQAAVALTPGMQESVPAAAAQPVASAAPEQAPFAWSSVDTLDTTGDQARGNWYIKQKIFQQARRLYQDGIRGHAQQVAQAARELLKQYDQEIQKLFEQLKNFDVKNDTIDKAIQSVTSAIEHSSSQVQLEAERTQLLQLHDQKNMLNEFSTMYTMMLAMQQNLEKSLTILKAQESAAHAYEKQAWDLYEKIDAALSDTVAEELYEEMQAIDGTLEGLGHYLQNNLQSYFAAAIPMFAEQIKKITEKLDLLQQHGFFVNNNEIVPVPQIPSTEKAEPQKIAGSMIRPWMWYVLLFISIMVLLLGLLVVAKRLKK